MIAVLAAFRSMLATSSPANASAAQKTSISGRDWIGEIDDPISEFSCGYVLTESLVFGAGKRGTLGSRRGEWTSLLN